LIIDFPAAMWCRTETVYLQSMPLKLLSIIADKYCLQCCHSRYGHKEDDTIMQMMRNKCVHAMLSSSQVMLAMSSLKLRGNAECSYYNQVLCKQQLPQVTD
jgi:hypothetical protein